jgi:hypothetical protein
MSSTVNLSSLAGPSFPHAFSGGIQAESRAGPPIKTFGGDAFRIASFNTTMFEREYEDRYIEVYCET